MKRFREYDLRHIPQANVAYASELKKMTEEFINEQELQFMDSRGRAMEQVEKDRMEIQFKQINQEYLRKSIEEEYRKTRSTSLKAQLR